MSLDNSAYQVETVISLSRPFLPDSTLLCRSKASFRSPGPEGQEFDLLTSKLAHGSLADHRLIFDDRASVGFDRMTEMALFEGLVVVRPDSVEASLG